MERTVVNEFIDNKNFYPTPPELVSILLDGLNLEGKFVLEPSAGSGNILSVLRNRGAKTLACEINVDLAQIAKTKCDTFLKNNFMEVNSIEVSHINYIIANPPFDRAEKHILHMWEIAPGGCEIRALCNYETVNNLYSNGRESLAYVIKTNGNYVNLGQQFINASRQTNVEVALVTLYKPASESDKEFEGYFDLSEEYEHQETGLMKHNELREIVSRYVSACQMYQSVIDSAHKINDLINPINNRGNIVFGAFQNRQGQQYNITRDEFKKELQKSAWHYIFDKLNMRKYVTKSVLENINKFTETQTNVPFTLTNIYKMLELIIGTHGSRMDQVIVDAFDRITKHYNDNRCGVEGWKTNDCFMVNRRFILPWIIEHNFQGKMSVRVGSYDDNPIDELTKALCYLSGKDYDTIGRFDSWMENYGENQYVNGRRSDRSYRDFGQWYEYGFLRIKGYKKGTLHAEFIDEKLWEKFNITAVKAKGWSLPPTTKHAYRSKETGVETLF